MNVWGESPLVFDGPIIMGEFAKHAAFETCFYDGLDETVKIFDDSERIP